MAPLTTKQDRYSLAELARPSSNQPLWRPSNSSLLASWMRSHRSRQLIRWRISLYRTNHDMVIAFHSTHREIRKTQPLGQPYRESSLALYGALKAHKDYQRKQIGEDPPRLLLPMNSLLCKSRLYCHRFQHWTAKEVQCTQTRQDCQIYTPTLIELVH